MSDLKMNAYYYGFDETGVREIDEILSAVACAGKGFHNTEGWTEPLDYMGGKCYAELIQEAANKAAKHITELQKRSPSPSIERLE